MCARPGTTPSGAGREVLLFTSAIDLSTHVMHNLPFCQSTRSKYGDPSIGETNRYRGKAKSNKGKKVLNFWHRTELGLPHSVDHFLESFTRARSFRL